FDGVDLNSYKKTWVQSLANGNYWIGLAKGQFMWDHSNSFVNFSQWRDRNLNLSFSCSVIYNDQPSNLKVWVNLNCPRYSYVVVCMKDSTLLTTTTNIPPFIATEQEVLKNPTLTSPATSLESQITALGIGVGVGVSFFVLLVVAGVVGSVVVCLWKKKKGCFRSLTEVASTRYQPDDNAESTDTYATIDTNIENNDVDDSHEYKSLEYKP
ncbi:hypothetical protein HELRODRAFT_184599, partial [Helobdella robusta]|uniref:C-type lectin domain-containing protein n=1 Tax=Helobdella robusta TaxID=6412 RepID=T1FLJ9_HELRO